MSKGKSRKVRTIDTMLVNTKLITKLLGDTTLYRCAPVFVPLRDKVIRTRDVLERIITERLQDRDNAVRQHLLELVDDFKQIVCEQVDVDGGVALLPLRRLLRERHNLDIGTLVFLCPQPGKPPRKILV